MRNRIRLKPRSNRVLGLCLVIFGCLTTNTLLGQVNFKVEILPDGQTYQVLFLPDTTWTPPDNITSTSQVTILAPSGGFEVDNVMALLPATAWSANSHFPSPSENPGFDYISFGLSSLGTSGISYNAGEEVPVFSFQNVGQCTGAVELMENDDPFFPPNSLQANVGNQLATLGGGVENNSFSANYDRGSANCIDENCASQEIEIDDILVTSSSDCGADDGAVSIIINETGNYEYSIDNGANWSASPDFFNLAPNTYFITARFENDTCHTNPVQINLTEPTAPTIDEIQFSNINDCNAEDGSIEIVASGGQTLNLLYSIDGGETWSENNQFNNLPPDIYNITVSNSDQTCIVEGEAIELLAPTAGSIDDVLVNHPTDCDTPNGRLEIVALSEETLEYSIDNGANWSELSVFNNLAAATYPISIRNIDGTCVVEGEAVTLLAPQPPTVDSTQRIHPSDCGLTNGSIQIFANGENPLEYSIDGGNNWQEEDLFSNLDAGFYPINVRYQGAVCQVEGNPVTLSAPATPIIENIERQNPTTCLGTDGNITILANNSYEYSLSNPDNWQPETTFSNLSEGFYTIFARNLDGSCQTTIGAVSLNSPPSPFITNLQITHSTECENGRGSIEIEAFGDNLEYSVETEENPDEIAWADAALFENLPAGTYYVKVRNSLSECVSESQEAMITMPSSPIVDSLIIIHPSGCEIEDGIVRVAATGSVDLEYSIDNGQNWSDNHIFSNLASGLYDVKVRNADGTCDEINGGEALLSGTGNFVIEDIQALPPSDCGLNDGSITILVNSLDDCETDCFEYSIDNGQNWATSNVFENLAVGFYDVLVRSTTGICEKGDLAWISSENCCPVEYVLEQIDEGRYQVSLLSNVTWEGDNNRTSTAQITIVAPTGSMDIDNLVNLIPNVEFEANARIDAPDENPEFDYISFGLISPGTELIPFQTGQKVPLFRFDNLGRCLGDSICLMNNEMDDFYPPNSQSANVGQQLSTFAGGQDMPICIGSNHRAGTPYLADIEPPCVSCSQYCPITFELELLDDGRFRVSMISDTTLMYPDNVTSTAQVTVVVPSAQPGQTRFQVTAIENLLPFVQFEQNARINAPAENPEADYIVFGLTTLATSHIPYIEDTKIPLFIFDYNGHCPGDDICLMEANDAFYPPNSQNANTGQQISVAGLGADVPVCVQGRSADDPCTRCPNPAGCLVEYELELLLDGRYQISLIPDTTWLAPNNQTSTAQVTIAAPTGGFEVINLVNLIDDVIFTPNSRYDAPEENPDVDYISFGLHSLETTGITYHQGVKVPLFTFENAGNCEGGEVYLIDNDTDPFIFPNSENANVAHQLTVAAYEPDVPVCSNTIGLTEGEDTLPCVQPVGNGPDDDYDGIPDWVEIGCSFEDFGTPACPDPLEDEDGDNIPNYQDADFCTLNANGVCAAWDTDGDGTPDFLDTDSDNDGLPDWEEACNLLIHAQCPTPTLTDHDFDGIDNAFDTDYGGPGLFSQTNNADGNGLPDFQDIDSDDDGILDEIETSDDFDNDSVGNWRDLDSDSDGIPDHSEAYQDGATPTASGMDSDNDGLDDAFDSDSGGLDAPIVHTDEDGQPDFLDIDTDGDGISDYTEGCPTPPAFCSPPTGMDTDGDGLDDAFDTDNGGVPLPLPDTDNDGLRNWRDLDSDNDGEPDEEECPLPSNCLSPEVIGISCNCPDEDGDEVPDYVDCPSANISLNSNAPICEGENLHLQAFSSVPNANYTWRLAATGQFISSEQNPVIQNLNSTTTFEVLVSGELCFGDSLASITVPVQTPPNFQPTFSLNGSSNCAIGSLQLFSNLENSNNEDFEFLWNGPNGFMSTAENPSIQNPTPSNNGSYILTLTASSGCQYTQTVEMNVIQNGITMPIISTTGPVCEGSSITLHVAQYEGIEVDYIWHLPDSTNVTGWNTHAITINPLITDLHEGDYSVTVFVDGCSNTSDTYNLDVLETISVTPTIVSQPVCTGDALQLMANAPGAVSYEWSGPNNFQSIAANPVISNTTIFDNGTYSVEAWTAAGCRYVGNIDVTIITPQPETPQIISNNPVCEGDSIRLRLQEAYEGNSVTFEWLNSFNQLIGTTETIVIAVNDPMATAPYRARVAINGCFSDYSNFEDIEIVSTPFANATIPANGIVCENDPIPLEANEIAQAIYEWRILGNETIISTVQNPLIQPSTPELSDTTLFELTIRLEGCSSIAQDTVEVYITPAPTIEGVPSLLSVCEGMDVFLSATNGNPGSAAITYTWTGPDGFLYSNEGSPEGSYDLVLSSITAAAAGTYTLTLTAGGGCSSAPQSVVIQVSEAVITPELGLDNEVLCQGQPLLLQTTSYSGQNVSYNWFFSPINNPNGNFLLNTTTQPTLLLPNVTPANTGFYSVQVIRGGCTSNPSALQQVWVFGPATNIEAFHHNEDGGICEGDNLQLGLPFIPNVTYQWFGPNEFSSDQPNPLILNVDEANEGEYYALVTLENCATIVTEATQVDIIPAPKPAEIFRPNVADSLLHNICAGDTLILEIQNPQVFEEGDTVWYQWYHLPADTLFATTTEPSLVIPDINSEASGIYNVLVINQHCASPVSDNFELNVISINPEIDTAYAGEDAFFCAANQITLEAVLPEDDNGYWTSPTGAVFTNPTHPNSQVSNLLEGENILIWTLSRGSCFEYASDTLVYQIGDVPVDLVNAGADTTLCGDTLIQLAASTLFQATGVWTQPQAQQDSGLVILNPTSAVTTVLGVPDTGTYTFTWTISIEDCPDFAADSVSIQILERPEGNAGVTVSEIHACGEESVLIETMGFPSSLQGLWTTNSSAIIDSPTSRRTTVTNLEEAVNVFVWSLSTNECSNFSSDTLTIYNDPAIQANKDTISLILNDTLAGLDLLANDDFGNTDEAIIRESFLIRNYPDHGTILESEEGIISYKPNQNFFGIDTILYEICNLNCQNDNAPNACDTALFTIKVFSPSGECFVTNLISPNGDGVNDFLELGCLDDAPNNQLMIFNRWGSKIYEAAPYRNNWSGDWKGRPLPAGVYFYVFKQDMNSAQGIQGHFTIFR